MEVFFKYATPVIYWILIVFWIIIFVFYFKKIKSLEPHSSLLKLLLIILAIDAFRTFFESLYFGAWYTSYSGLIPIGVFNFLAKQEVVFIPKFFNLVAAILVLTLIIKKWISSEISEKTIINELVTKQIKEIKKLSIAVEQSANSIVITDLEGNIEYTNQKFTDISGYTAEDVLGKNPRVLNSGEQSKSYYGKMWKAILSGEKWSGEFKNKSKSGRLYWEQVTISPIKNDLGKIINFLAIKEDISRRKESDLKLLEQKSLFETMFNSITDAIIITNTKREIVLANKGMENTFGYSLNELLEKSTKILYVDDENFKNTGKKVFDESVGVVDNNLYLNTYKKKNGEVFNGETFGVKLFDTHKQWIGNLGVMRNVDERINFINEIKLAKQKAEESDQLKTEFLNNMSHEIRTPMNGVLGFSEMLSNPNLSDEKRQNFVNIIQNSGRQLLQIIDDILEISRLETKQIKVREEEICLNNFLFQLFSIFDIKAKEQEMPLYLKTGLSDKESTVLIDGVKLNKVLSNLLGNALKFTNKGFIEIGYTLNNNEIEFYVKDTGVGIAPEKHKVIFERFSQADKELTEKVGGLGLGLSIAKENAQLLGGEIQVESMKGKGATFSLTIPYKPLSPSVEIDNNCAKKTILIAEDEEVNYIYLETLINDLLKLDVKIVHAKNGQEAVEIIKNNETIDFILMDLKMPIMSGFDAAKMIKEINPNITIVAQTAYSTTEEKEKALAMGCDDFISKPINREGLKLVTDKYLVLQ
ncbi:PAS domain S-box protein [Lutibacter sp.]|uniref:PAS domain S-box protein n=1 Tax=Lutibacter sp. TaxID=1925666 RepID=UPI0025C71E6E|nr:PAS domain S-box protein [Lutibacter sp.]